MEGLIGWSLVSAFVGSYVGAYVGAYLKKKAENLATHEDLDKLVEQVRAVTMTTKEVEAKISDDVWRRQKHWQSKQDALFDLIKQLRATEESLVTLKSALELRAQSSEPAHLDGKAIEAVETWSKVTGAFDEATLIGGTGVRRRTAQSLPSVYLDGKRACHGANER